MEKGGTEDLFIKQVPKQLYRSYNASKHVVRFPNGSNLFFGHIKTDADLLQYQGAEFLFVGWEELTQFTLRHTNEELVAEKIVNANHTGDKFDRIGSIFLSPDRFAKIDQHHSIADKMGDVFVQYGLPRPERANNRRVDGWRLCYTLFDTDGVTVLDNCRDVIESIPQLQRDEKDIEDAQAEGNELFLDVCDS